MAETFSAATARRIVGVSQRCLDYWDETGVVRPSIERANGKGSVRRYSFDDLLRLSVVKSLRNSGLSLQRIRKGLQRLRKRSSSGDPLRTEVLITDGKKLHRVGKNSGAVEDVLAGGQLVFSVVALGQIDHSLREKVVKLGKKSGRRDRRSARQKRA
jgi:DNA-binding transcriptional MerR regulator